MIAIVAAVRRMLVAIAALAALAAPVWGQSVSAVKSPELNADGTATFRLLAPEAKAVRIFADDLLKMGSMGSLVGDTTLRNQLQKDDKGVWSITLGPVAGGAYRYVFNVDGVPVADPRNTATHESTQSVESVLYVPGSDISDTKPVPHGAVATVIYDSKVVGKPRRMHIYIPPGYEKGAEKYPVLYLIHGGGGSDDSWPTVGRAGFILDNLNAAGKAKPMIVVMPDANITSILPRSTDDFARDFLEDVIPYVEASYRVQADRAHRALAGLSQGGVHTLIIGVPHLDKFAYLGVFSSGLLNMYGNDLHGRYGVTTSLPPSEPNWEEEHKDVLDDAALKHGLKLFWVAIGKDDFLYPEHERTVALLRKHKFDVTVKVSDGNHSWINWRQYLAEFAPQLFR